MGRMYTRLQISSHENGEYCWVIIEGGNIQLPADKLPRRRSEKSSWRSLKVSCGENFLDKIPTFKNHKIKLWPRLYHSLKEYFISLNFLWEPEKIQSHSNATTKGRKEGDRRMKKYVGKFFRLRAWNQNALSLLGKNMFCIDYRSQPGVGPNGVSLRPVWSLFLLTFTITCIFISIS